MPKYEIGDKIALPGFPDAYYSLNNAEEVAIANAAVQARDDEINEAADQLLKDGDGEGLFWRSAESHHPMYVISGDNYDMPDDYPTGPNFAAAPLATKEETASNA